MTDETCMIITYLNIKYVFGPTHLALHKNNSCFNQMPRKPACESDDNIKVISTAKEQIIIIGQNIAVTPRQQEFNCLYRSPGAS